MRFRPVFLTSYSPVGFESKTLDPFSKGFIAFICFADSEQIGSFSVTERGLIPTTTFAGKLISAGYQLSSEYS